MKELTVIKLLIPLMRRYPRLLSTMVVIGLLAALTEGIGISLFIPFLYSLNEEFFEPDSDNWFERVLFEVTEFIPESERLLIISLCIFALVLVKSALVYGNAILYGSLDMRLSHYLRCRVFDQILSIGFEYMDRKGSGSLLNTLENETGSTSEAIATLVGLVISMCTILILTIFLLFISWRLTLLVAFSLVLISLVIQFITGRVEAIAREGLRADETLYQRIVEALSGLRTIRVFGRKHHEYRRFAQASEHVGKTYMRLEKLAGLVQPVSELLAVALLIFVLFTMLQDVNNLPTVLVFIFILYRIHPQVMELDEARTEVVASTAAVEEVTSYLNIQDKPYIKSGSVVHDGLCHSIRFESVSYSYESGEAPALDNISISISSGKTIAFVGPSGAGKSTLVSLILRFYDPTKGTIYVDDVPLKELRLSSWYKRIAVVWQDSYLFNTSIRENIAYGDLKAKEDDIIEAAKQADAHDFICGLPHGYETRVGERGVLLSSGQKQRIAIARAIVRKPEILILDEATNALDSIAENAIHDCIEKIKHGRTVIIIAHRLSAVERADEIFVLRSGHVVERGTVHQLLENDKLFTRLYKLQSLSLELGN